MTRIDELLAAMTLEEKIGQLNMVVDIGVIVEVEIVTREGAIASLRSVEDRNVRCNALLLDRQLSEEAEP